jgi:hypothetical protein
MQVSYAWTNPLHIPPKGRKETKEKEGDTVGN